MNKDRIKLISLIKDNKYSIKVISDMTGYHPKSIIRIKKLINNGTYLNNQRKITDKEKNDVIKMAQDYATITAFYEVYKKQNGRRSYASIYNILRKKKPALDIIIIGNIKEVTSFKVTYYAYDYKTKQLIYLENSYGNALINYINIIKKISSIFGIPNKIYCYGNSFIKNINSSKSKYFNKMCNDYQIMIDNTFNHHLVSIKKDIENKINKNNLLVTQNKISSTNNKKTLINHIIINIIKCKILNNNTIEYDNTIYKINNINVINNHDAILYFYEDILCPQVKIDNMIYGTSIISKKESKKKY